MTSFIDSLAASEKTAVVIDIGHAYTKCGFAGNSSPRHIVPTTVTIHGDTKSVFEDNLDLTSLRERLTEFIRLIYYKYNIANCRERRVVIVESVITPTRIRHLLADILLKQFEASSLAFVPSHLGATFTLGRSTALVLDVGYKEAQIMPVAEGVPLAVEFDSVSYAGQAIHKQIELLLRQHASVIHQGQKKAFNEANLKLSEDILEDIKVRCCFVSPFARAQIYAKNKLGFDESFKEASSVNYPLGPETIIRIPGLVREFACEVLFEQDIDGRSVATLILDALIRSSLDLRRQFADNILVIGGTAMLPGFLHRLNAELTHLVNISTYVNKLAIKQFHFHSPPSQLNYTAWLGGSIIGALDTLESQSILRERYLDNGIVPDWFTGEQAA
jgi:actin-related protein 10